MKARSITWKCSYCGCVEKESWGNGREIEKELSRFNSCSECGREMKIASFIPMDKIACKNCRYYISFLSFDTEKYCFHPALNKGCKLFEIRGLAMKEDDYCNQFERKAELL